jgi:hypothetical protein
MNTNHPINIVRQPMITTIDGNQSLTNGIEIKNTGYETNTNIKSSI